MKRGYALVRFWVFAMGSEQTFRHPAKAPQGQ